MSVNYNMKLDKEDLFAIIAILFAGVIMFGWLYSIAYSYDKEIRDR